MPYQYLDDVATADVAFEAWGKSREEMFIAAADAVMNVMIENMEAIVFRQERTMSLEAETIEALLFQFLQEFVYYKDAEQLLLRVSHVDIHGGEGSVALTARGQGEVIDAGRHRLCVDVKAVTMHRFKVTQDKEGWTATVVLDI